MIVIILADSYKKGSKSNGCCGLIPFGKNQNLIQQQHRAIKSIFPKSKIVYVYGFDGKKFGSYIKKHPLVDTKTVFNENHSKHSEGHSLSLALEEVDQDQDCLIVFGYDPLDKDELNHIKSTKRSTALLGRHNKTNLGCIVDRSANIINHIFFGLDNYISNTYFLKKTEVQILKQILQTSNTNNMFLFEIINSVISKNGILTPMVI